MALCDNAAVRGGASRAARLSEREPTALWAGDRARPPLTVRKSRGPVKSGAAASPVPTATTAAAPAAAASAHSRMPSSPDPSLRPLLSPGGCPSAPSVPPSSPAVGWRSKGQYVEARRYRVRARNCGRAERGVRARWGSSSDAARGPFPTRTAPVARVARVQAAALPTHQGRLAQGRALCHGVIHHRQGHQP